MYKGSTGNKPPLLPIGAERAIRLRTSNTLNQKLRTTTGGGQTNAAADLTPEWGRPYKTYFKATKLTFVPPLADMRDSAAVPQCPKPKKADKQPNSSSASDESTLKPERPECPIHNPQSESPAAGISKDEAQAQPGHHAQAVHQPKMGLQAQTGHQAQSSHQAQTGHQAQMGHQSQTAPSAQPKQPQPRLGLGAAKMQRKATAGRGPAKDKPLEYTNEILYNDLVKIQKRSCKLAQYIREALPTHMQRQLFQQEIIGQHLMAERKFCKLLEARHKAIFEWLAKNTNHNPNLNPSTSKSQKQKQQQQTPTQAQTQEQKPKQKRDPNKAKAHKAKTQSQAQHHQHKAQSQKKNRAEMPKHTHHHIQSHAHSHAHAHHHHKTGAPMHPGCLHGYASSSEALPRPLHAAAAPRHGSRSVAGSTPRTGQEPEPSLWSTPNTVDESSLWSMSGSSAAPRHGAWSVAGSTPRTGQEPEPSLWSTPNTVDGSSLWTMSGSSAAEGLVVGKRPWGLPPALQGSLFSTPPSVSTKDSLFGSPPGDVEAQESAKDSTQGSSQGTLKGSPLATIPGSPADTSQGSSQGTLHGSQQELEEATPMPTSTPTFTFTSTPQASTSEGGAAQRLDSQTPPVDPKAIAPWCRPDNCPGGASHKANGAATPALLYQEPSQWPPIGATTRSTSGGATATATATANATSATSALPAVAAPKRASSLISLGPNPWPLIGAPSRPPSRAPGRNASRAPARTTSRGPPRSTSRAAPRSPSRTAQRRSQRSTSRAHRQPHPSVVLGCTPWAHVKAAAAPTGPAKFHATAEQQHGKYHATGEYNNRFNKFEKHFNNNNYSHHNYPNQQTHNNGSGNNSNQQTKRIYGGVPKTEPSSRMYTGILPPPPRVPMPQSNVPTPHMLEDQQLGIAMSKQLSLAHTRQYTAIQKRPQATVKKQSGLNLEPDRNPDPTPKQPKAGQN